MCGKGVASAVAVARIVALVGVASVLMGVCRVVRSSSSSSSSSSVHQGQGSRQMKDGKINLGERHENN